MKWLIAGLLCASVSAEAAVSQDANGWTVITPSGDSKIVYVSSSTGNDACNGLTQTIEDGSNCSTANKNGPEATPAAGYGDLRDGFPDHVLLKKGDTFTAGFAGWTKSGRSASEPMVLSSYGTGARPLIRLVTRAYCIRVFGAPATRNYLAFMGIDCYAAHRDWTQPEYGGAVPITNSLEGIDYAVKGDWVLLEDMVFRFFTTGVSISAASGTGVITNAQLRRNIIRNNYSVDTHAQGVYCSRVDGFLIEENLTDHNGWDSSRECDTWYSGCQEATGAANIFNHNYYLQMIFSSEGTPSIDGCRNVTFKGNISSNASSHGIKGLMGGDFTNNLFIDNPINFLSGSSLLANLDSVSHHNVVNGSVNICEGCACTNTPTACINGSAAGGSPIAIQRGTAYSHSSRIDNAKTLDFHHNLALHDGAGTGNFNGLSITCDAEDQIIDGTVPPTPVGICNGNTITNNVFYDWPSGCISHETGTTINEVAQNNDYDDVPTLCTASGTNRNSDLVSYPDATRTVATYNSIVRGGTASNAAFLDAAKLQSKDNWDTTLMAKNVNAWIRAGFGIPEETASPAGGSAIVGGSVSGGRLQ